MGYSKKSDILIVVLISLITIILTIYTHYFWFPNDLIDEGNEIKNYDDYQVCANLSLKKTAKCMIDYTREFYIYNITEDNLTLTLQDLKDRGGDCRNWAFYYEDFAHQLGYISKTTRIDLPGNSAHRIAIISNEEGWCAIDQKSYKCVSLNIDIEDEK